MLPSNSPFRSKGVVFNFLRVLLRSSRLLRIRLGMRRKFAVGKMFSIGKSADIRSPSFFYAGDRVGVGKNFTVEANVIIGGDVLISSNVSLVGNDHKFDDPTSTVYSQGRFSDATIEIGGDNLIGFGAIVIGPVKIGKGCIVAAGSVVVSDLPEYTVCGGVPARVLRKRYP